MDEKLFLQRLSEVAEWHRPQTGPNGCYSLAKGKTKKLPQHPGPITEAELDLMSEDEVTAYYDRLIAWREAQPNDSVPPEIVRVKIQAKDCEDCGQHCPEGRRTEKKLHDSGSLHWRENCKECGLFRDPLTDQFTVRRQVAHQYFTQFYRPKLGKYKSKYQPKLEPKESSTRPSRSLKLTKSQLMEKIIAEGRWETNETEDSITRTFIPKL